MSVSKPPGGDRGRQQRKAQADLEWAELLDAIADGCMSEQTGTRMRALTPAGSLAAARQRMERTAAALEALRIGEPVPGQSVPAIDSQLEHLSKGGRASGEDLRDIARVLELAQTLRSYADSMAQRIPLLSRVLRTEPSLDRLQATINRAIDQRGCVLDAASKALSSARQRTKSERRALLDKLEQLMSRYADVLREGSYVERDGRYGIPVRGDAHRKVEGIVLGSSASGATLYVEPPSVTAIGNRLKLVEAEADREEARVLAELSARVQQDIEPLADAYQRCLDADELSALSRWARLCKGIAIMPDDGHDIDLEAMRHPLLVSQEGAVVANDIKLSAGQALVISGPNAGGKTVALKCLGLAVWMVRAGLPLPAREPSKVGWFGSVLTDIGDDQSLSRSLSTFSAQIANLSEMLEQADGQSLVLLDEVAGGTDPEEGSALAAAVLTALVQRGAAVAVTTHYERLKDLAAEDNSFVNASVAFDFDEMRPTFALTIGVPGASSALAVARRFGMPDAVITHAQSLLSQATVDREQLLAQIERERSALADARSAAEQDAQQVETMREEIEAERLVVRNKERKKLADASAELVGQVRDARAKLRELHGQLENSDSASTRRDAERRIDEAARLVSVDGPLTKATREPRHTAVPAPSQLRVGSKVYVERLGTHAEVIEAPERGEVRVQAGAFAIRVPIKGLRLDDKAPAAKKATPKRAKRQQAPVAKDVGREIRTSDNTCDLRGERVEEALEQVDRFVDDMSRGPEHIGFVLHGHGTGALKRAVRDHLALSSRIARTRPANSDEGGDAFTVFWLS